MSYIVPRKKPDRCTNCLFIDKITYDCKLMYGNDYPDFESQYANCPLIEIPTPHGRLIDADALNIYDISPVNGFCVMGVTEEDIAFAETVIEAEGRQRHD